MKEIADKKYNFGEFKFDTDGNILIRDGAIVPLEPSSAKVLRYFLENSDRLILKNEILETVWRDVFTTEEVLKRAVSQIRRALGDDPKNSRFIETHHRRGYRFKSNQSANYQKTPEIKENNDPQFACFVGREREMEFLQAEFRRTLSQSGQPVLIIGEAGIGKTQTAAHFTNWAKSQENALSLRIRFFDYEAAYLPPYNVFLDLLTEACAKVFGAENDLRQAVQKHLKIELPNELFSQNIENRQTVDASRAIAPLAKTFVRLSRVRPLILVFDDVQWADQTSQKIIGYLMRTSFAAPLMILGLIRRGKKAEESDDFSQWLQKQAVYRSYTMLELAPLLPEDYRLLIEKVFLNQLDTSKISDGDLSKLHSATGGNPYFLVETLRLLISENVIEKGSNKWIWNGLQDVPLPETVRLAARAKLSDLTADTREMVECAAVLGDTFQIKTLALMIAPDAPDEEFIEKSLDETIAAQVFTEENVSGTDDCQFYHTTLRRAVYMDLSPRRRKRLHSRAMRAIETSHVQKAEKFSAALAAHAENADEFEKSLDLNLRACRAAIARFDWLEAAELMTRAVRVSEKSGIAETPDFLSVRGEVYMSVGRRAEAEKILIRAAEMSESATVWHNLGKTRILLGKYHEAVAPLEKSLKLAYQEKDDFAASAALIQLASAKYGLCDYETAGEILQKIISEEDEKSYNRAVALGKLGWICALQSRYAEGKKLLESALDFHQTAGDMRERAVLAMCLNSCEHGTGNYESAIEFAQQAQREAQIVGEPYNESVAMMRIARARIAQGFYAEAEQILLETWEKQKDLAAKHAQAETIWMFGRAKLEQGKFAEASEDLQNSLEMIEKIGDRDDEFRILIDQARLQNDLENYAEALKLTQKVKKICIEIGVSEGVGEALIEESKALAALGKTDDAINTARESIRILEEFNSGERWKAHFALAQFLIAKEQLTDAEFALRRAIEILDQMRSQFSEQDEKRYFEFTLANNLPAQKLSQILSRQRKNSEAEELRRQWLTE